MKQYRGLSHTSPQIVTAERIAEEQLTALGVTEVKSRTFIIHRGGKRPGLRVTTIRLTDGMTKTKFIPEK